MLPILVNFNNLRALGQAARVGAVQAGQNIEDVTLGTAFAAGQVDANARGVARGAKYAFFLAGGIGIVVAGSMLINAVKS